MMQCLHNTEVSEMSSPAIRNLMKGDDQPLGSMPCSAPEQPRRQYYERNETTVLQRTAASISSVHENSVCCPVRRCAPKRALRLRW